MYVKDLPLLHIMSESTIFKLAKSKGWTEKYAAAWSLLYFRRGHPASNICVKELEPKMIKRNKRWQESM